MPDDTAKALARTTAASDARAGMLIEAGLALASELDLDAVLDRIVELAVAITGARYGALGVLGEDRPRIERFITHGVTAEQRAAIGDPPVGHGILGLLIRERRPMRIPEIGADPRSAGFPPNHPPMHSFLGAPVKALGQIFGNIYLTEKQDAAEFTEDDEQALVVLATQAGVAIENARLYEETRRHQEELARLELLEERERIAKELHDGVIQALFAVGMGLQGTAAMTSDAEIARRIENATEEVDRAIRDLRNYIFGLRPGILADRQLGQALQQLAAEFQERTDVLTIVDVDGAVAAELASRAADVVQLVREALSNVGRHADATSCRVSLRRSDGGAELEIDDDGRGFDPATPSSGMGMGNLRARISSLGGELSIESVAGEGTTIIALLPL
ncbi:MAG: GAF domain-containing sensor histidine kinase [Actinomycetota bacterium]|nr:GAF domain-containing sensor histidine kinase [Actinomycetota bacterium]MDH5312609.1 GAF domain-containing sensor histidine kinase [Actinomycetota bacterium]